MNFTRTILFVLVLFAFCIHFGSLDSWSDALKASTQASAKPSEGEETGDKPMQDERPGYNDTPMLPGSAYRVHDKERPQPPVVAPGTASTQKEPGTAPADAVILFDGTDLSKWTGKGDKANWKVENGYMEVVPGAGGITTREHFGDCQLHVEWAAPARVKGTGQGNGNSGVFPMGRYEIQILDSYQSITYADGLAGGIYGQFPPLVNACRKPGEWQTYDIVWRAPRFDGEKLQEPARLTLFHNGVLVHHDQELVGPTTHRNVLPYKAHAEVGPLALQDHGHLVRFRNIWCRPVRGYDSAE